MFLKRAIKRLVFCTLWATSSVYAGTTINLITNSDFSDSSVPSGSYQYHTDQGFWASSWIFSDSSSGIANSSNAWGGEATYSSVAFLQYNYGSMGSVSQVITSDATQFKISFDVAQRRTPDFGFIEVFFDNDRLIGYIFPNSTEFETYTLNATALPGTLHTISFRSVAPQDVDASYFSNNVDTSIFLKNVSVTAEY